MNERELKSEKSDRLFDTVCLRDLTQSSFDKQRLATGLNEQQHNQETKGDQEALTKRYSLGGEIRIQQCCALSAAAVPVGNRTQRLSVHTHGCYKPGSRKFSFTLPHA